MAFDSVWDCLAVAALTVGLLQLALAAWMSRSAIRRWNAVLRLYEAASLNSLMRDMQAYVGRGSLMVARDVPPALLLAGVAAYIVQGFVESWTSHWPEYVVLAIGSVALRSIMAFRFGLPPAVLLLGPSCRELFLALTELNQRGTPFRTVALIRPATDSKGMNDRHAAYLNNLRTFSLYQWRTIVFHLMDVVPLIVVCDGESEPVREEVDRLERRGYANRTIRVRRDDLADPEARRALAERVLLRLSQVDDQRERFVRQEEFREIGACVPFSLRYPINEWQFVAKAHFLIRFGMARFIANCKSELPLEENPFLEDYPSRLTSTEELGYLREDRAFEEVEILLRSIEGDRGHGPFSEFNRANLVTKQGLLARIRREWNIADERLRTAIRLLEPMTEGNLARQANLETAVAYFILGDVHLAQYRETDDASYRDQARQLFERSIEYDERGGGETASARGRLASL